MVKILGHRGNPARHRDNELIGIREAAEIAHGAEVDVRRAGSGELVLCHDSHVAGAVVAETGLAELRRLDERLATASTLFDADLPGDLDLEVKNSPVDPGFEADHGIALEVAERARPNDLVTCFYWPTIDAVSRHLPGVATGLLFEMGTIADAVGHAVRLGHRWIAPHHSLLTSPDQIGLAHGSGVAVAAWTVDERSRVEELARWRVDTIITNRPLEAVAWTEELQT